MHHVGLDVVQEALIVRDDDGGVVRSAQQVDTFGHDAEGVDVEAAVRLVEDGERGLEHGHLEDLVALLLAAGEAFVHAAVHQAVVQLHDLAFLTHQLEEVGGRNRLLATVLAAGIDGRAHEVHHAHAGDLHGVLEAEEDAFAATLFGGQLQEVFALEGH